MTGHVKILISLCVVLALILGILSGSYYWFRSTHLKVDGILYESNAEALDLRGQDITREHYENLQAALPDCRILWDVPFQNGSLSSDTEEITVWSLKAEDVEQLSCLKNLKQVNAEECYDYEGIQLLQKTYPEIRVNYNVGLDGQLLPMDAESLQFESGRGGFEELMEKLQYLPDMKTIAFEEPELKPEELAAIQEAYPEISLSWEKTLFGEKVSFDTEELDISGMEFDSVEEIESQTAYVPGLKKLVMCDTGLPNEEIAAFRERAREKFKVIWNVKIGQFNVRTDETWFMPTKFHKDVKDRDMQNMRYCEDMVCIDLGHNVTLNIDWLEGTPHLKYLVLADGPLKNIEPIGQLKELKFLELFMTDIRDITPVLGCTALEDLNVARIPADLKPLAEMKWLKNLWMSGGRVSRQDEAYLREQLPDTHIDAALHHNCTGRGWRQLQNYIDMRNMLDMPIFPE